MARAALGLSVRELSDKAEVAESTIHRFELGRGGLQSATLARLEAALVSAGVVFINADGHGGPGVRLRE